MKNEKAILIIIFTTFFVLSSCLIYLMIKKDIVTKEAQVQKMNQPRESDKPQIWPKVEIQTGR